MVRTRLSSKVITSKKSPGAFPIGGKSMSRPAVHPGRILKDKLDVLGVCPKDFARQIGVPESRVSVIIKGERGISADTALRLGHWFRTDAQVWLFLQVRFDLAIAEQKSGAKIRTLPSGPVSPRLRFDTH